MRWLVIVGVALLAGCEPALVAVTGMGLLAGGKYVEDKYFARPPRDYVADCAARGISAEHPKFADCVRLLYAADHPNNPPASTGQNAYGPGIHSDQYGRPIQWQTQDGQRLNSWDTVKPNAYGLGVGMDQFGRPVYAVPGQ